MKMAKKATLVVTCLAVITMTALRYQRYSEEKRRAALVEETLLSFYPEAVKISPDGKTVLLKTRHLDDFELFLKDVTTGSLRSIDRSTFTQLSITWLPSGNVLLYQAFDPAVHALRLHELDLKSGVRKAVPFPESRSAIAPLRWSPNGKHLAYFIDGTPPRLTVFEYARGTTILDWTDTDRQYDFQWKDDAVITVRSHENPGALVNLSLSGKPIEKLTLAPGGEVQEFAWNAAGTELAATVRKAGADFTTLVHYSLRTKKTSELFAGDWDARRPHYVSRDTLLFHENKQGLWRLHEINLKTKADKILPCEEAHCEFLEANAENIFFLKRPTTKGPELVELSRDGTRVMHSQTLATAGLAPHTLNLGFPAFLWKTNATVEKRYGVVEVHGGPKLQIRPVWQPYRDLITQAGADFLTLDYHGAVGNGKKFEDDSNLSKMVQDVLSAIDYLINQRQIPANRIFLLGRSFGSSLAIEALANAAPSLGGAVFQSPLFTKAVGDFPRPQLPLHFFFGAYDPLTNLSDTRKIFDAPHYQWHQFNDEGHDFHRTRSWAEVYSVLLSFISSS